jgi:hypothetical protein
MMKHYVLTLNPAAQFEWERCVLQDPITAEQPNFADLIATSVSKSIHEEVHQRSGSYLIAVKLEVTVLETSVAESIPNSFPNAIAIPLLESNRAIRKIDDRIPEVA